MAFKVAQEVVAYCSQCKMDLGAVIVAMKGDQIVRVECKTCRKERAYKAPKGVKDPGAEAPVKKESKRASAARNADTGEKVDRSIGAEWRKVMNQHISAPTDTYSPKTKYKLGAKIKHPTFGDGVVTKQIHPNKVEVIFEMDLKVLICGGHA